MKNIAQLVDDLLAFRRGEIAFDAVTDHVSTQLVKAPHAAEDVLKQIDRAFDSKLLEPSQVVHLKTIVADTIAPHNAQLTERIRVDISLSQVGGGGGRRGGVAQPVSRSNIPLGTRLRERFVLDEVLGAGGMGTVYKGRDLLKVEARDRNPYVAIKVLNDDFRKRDDAFIVLQREASRQQRLAHPNVATVYDFDRTGDTFFISMELLEGTPLDSFMADSRGRGGVSWEEARPLIEGMGAALTYAHEHGIVHADFKPSNCFMMKDGKVKVLDFGIARAIKRPNQAPSDVTVYDGASIGALTPAYASSEMLEGNSDPDPTDDVYGFACVCYELLSGKHPYNRLSARDARYQKLVPKRINGLTSRQNRALHRALAFDRTARTQSVREFVADLEAGSAAQSLWNRKRIAIAAVIIVIIGGAIAWYRIEYPISRTIAEIRSDNTQTAQAAIDRLATLSPTDRARVIAGARAEIADHYQKQVRRMLDTGEIDAAYAKAESMLAAGLQIDPDAQPLLQLRTEVARRKDRYLSELAEQYETYLAAGRLLKSREHGDIQGVMQRIRLVDPNHPLLTDPRVAGAFANAADTAIDNGKLDDARTLLADALTLAPNDRALLDVNDKLASADREARLRQRSAELVAQINSRLGMNPTLDAIAATTPALNELREIDSSHAVIARAAAAARSSLGTSYDAITSIATVGEVVAFERRYEPTFEALGLADASARTSARRQALETRRDRLLSDARGLAANPSAKSGASLGELLQQVRTIAPDDSQIAAIVTSAISELRRESQRLSAAGQWKDARSLLSAAVALDGSPAVRTQIDQDLARIEQREQDGIQQTLLAEREAARTAERQRIVAAETQLQTELASFSPTANGLAALDTRIAALAALDPGNAMIDSARSTAAQRIAGAATEAAKAGRFSAALALLARASVDLPGAAEIAKARTQVESMQGEAAKRAQENAVVEAQRAFRTLLERPATTESRWQRETEAAIAAIRKVSSSEAPVETARGQLANAYLASADRLIAEKRFTVASQMVDKAEQLTPRTAAVQTRRDQWARAFESDKNERAVAEATAKVDAAKQRFTNEVKGNQLDRARRTLMELQKLAGSDTFVTREAPAMLSSGYVSLAQARLKVGDVGGAWRLAAAGETIVRDDARYTQLRADIDATANRRVEALLSTRGTVDGAELASLARTYRTNAPNGYESHKATWTTRIKDQLANLAADPTAHNTYLLAAQGAFEDLPAIQSIRPLAARAPIPLATPPVTTVETTPGNGNGSSPAPAAITQSPSPARTIPTPNQAPATTQQAATTQPTPAPAPAFEPSLTGKWCGDGGLAMTFAANQYTFDFGRGTVTYPVERYQRNGNAITMMWSDKNLGAMLMEFGDFSSDGQGMVQVRGKTASAAQWQTYNRKFRKCN